MLPTLGGATLGGALLGAAPKTVGTSFQVLLAGVPLPADLQVEALTLTEHVDQRATADLTLVRRTNGPAVAEGTRIDVREGGLVLFSGTVERNVRRLVPTSARAVAQDLTCVDASQIADRRVITERIDFQIDDGHPNGWPAGEVVRSLVNSYLTGEGVTARSVEVGSAVTAAFEFQSVGSAIDQLAERLGWHRRIGPHRDLFFGPRPQNPAPWPIVQSYPIEVQSTPGLVGYWRLGEATGQATAVDLGPNGLHGTWTGSPTLAASGLLVMDTDRAATFTGSSFVSVGDVLDFPGLAPYTITAWARPTSLGTGFTHRVFQKGSVASAASILGALLTLGPRLFRFVDGVSVVANGPGPLTLSAANYVAGVYTGSQLIAYLNGIAGTAVSDARSMADSTIAARLGADNNGAAQWAGELDEVSIYDRALSTTEIQNFFNAGRDVWTHRPLVEAVQVEGTRERLRTVQYLRAPIVSVVVSQDDGRHLPEWSVAGSVHQVVDSGTALFQSGRTFYQCEPTAYLYRNVGFGLSHTLSMVAGEARQKSATNTVGYYAHYFVGVTGEGAGPVFWFDQRSDGNGVAEWTTARGWDDVDTPTDLRPFSGAGFFGPDNTQRAVTFTYSLMFNGINTARELRAAVEGILTNWFPYEVASVGPYFGLKNAFTTPGTQNLGAWMSLFTYVSTLVQDTWFTGQASAAIQSLQAVEGGTGEYGAVEVRPDFPEVSSTEAQALADAPTRRFGTPATVLTFTTEEPGLRAGQLQHVHITALGLDDHEMLLETVEITRGEDQKTRYRVTAVSDEQQGLGGAEFWAEEVGR